ncbi:MAG TPA: hypothetical protein VFL86_05070, partial [Burkholderiaceae bacterium]|nr:hypothetical protein [Burkholderiaceae bacterium]
SLFLKEVYVMNTISRIDCRLMETVHADRPCDPGSAGTSPDRVAISSVGQRADQARKPWPSLRLVREKVATIGPRPRNAKLPEVNPHASAIDAGAGLLGALDLAGQGHRRAGIVTKTSAGLANVRPLERVSWRQDPDGAVLVHSPGAAVVPHRPVAAEGSASVRRAGIESLTKPERLAHWRSNLEEYKAIVSSACNPPTSDVALLSPSEGRLLAEMQRAVIELEAMLPSLERCESHMTWEMTLERMRLVVTYARKDMELRNMGRDLALWRPDLVIRRLSAFGHLLSAADGLRKSIARDALQYGYRSPEVMDYLRQLDRAIGSASSQAFNQGRVQMDILETLRDAAQGYADADIEGRQSDVRSMVVRLFSPHREPPAEAVGQIQQELQQSFGDWFHIERLNPHRLSLSIRPDVVGRQSCADLLRALAHMTNNLCTRRDRHILRAAFAASPDVELVRDSHGEKLVLTPAALKRMTIGGSVDLDAVPGAALRSSVVAAVEGIDLAVLKFSLMESFRGRVDRIARRALSPFNLHTGLTLAKAHLMHELLQDLMSSQNINAMMRLLDQAIERHRTLWQLEWGAGSGGETEAVLDDMRSCAQRFVKSA